MASAQVKSAILLAGLGADGETVVHEPVATRAHTEEMLAAAGADIDFTRVGGGRTSGCGEAPWRPGDLAIPGDPSQAAFWVVAAAIVPGSPITVTDIQPGHRTPRLPRRPAADGSHHRDRRRRATSRDR